MNQGVIVDLCEHGLSRPWCHAQHEVFFAIGNEPCECCDEFLEVGVPVFSRHGLMVCDRCAASFETPLTDADDYNPPPWANHPSQLKENA